jgi:hypothetical protein
VNDVREVRLPADLCAAVEKKLGPAFGSLEELLVFILQDLSTSGASRFDDAEQRLIEERLRDLGYL